MSYVLTYTKRGDAFYSDVNDAMHLALSRDGKEFIPMRNHTGILFPKATFCEGKLQGTTKTLLYPWLFVRKDGTYGVCCIRRNENAPDPLSKGCIMLFSSADLIRYEEAGFLKVAEEEVRSPRCRWEAEKDAYYLEWETGQGIFCGYTRYFMEVGAVKPLPAFTMETADAACGKTSKTADAVRGKAPEIPDAVYGNILEIPEETADRLQKYFGVIYNTGVDPVEWEIAAGQEAPLRKLPRAVCRYSDGSVHEKLVDWDREALAAIDFSRPGEYEVAGRIRQKHYPFPLIKEHISDPCITFYNGKYYLSCSGNRSVSFRISDTIEGLFTAEPVVVYALPEEDREHANMWAQELHIIHGVPYVLTTVGGKEWYTVRSHILRCNGDPGDPAAWEAPRLVLKPDGTELNEQGISLDMTYFCVDGVHYVMWSNRVIHRITADGQPGGAGASAGYPGGNAGALADQSDAPEQCAAQTAQDAPETNASHGTGTAMEGEVQILSEPADIYIATVDPDAPWQLTTNPVCICRPIYGWDRLETEVDEGPYLLRRGDDLFVTISGSSTGVPDLYCMGLLHARRGNNLLSPGGWDWLPYPVLTKESVAGEYGPGHNNFIKDAESGDDIMVYHAVLHDEDGNNLGRHMAMRRVHWAANGYPYLEMTEERDLDPAFRQVCMKIRVTE